MIAIFIADNTVLATREDWGLVENTVGAGPIGWNATFVVNGITYTGFGWHVYSVTLQSVMVNRKAVFADEYQKLRGYNPAYRRTFQPYLR